MSKYSDSNFQLIFCAIFADENDPKFICGRPLGLAFDTIGDNLIVMDTSSGVFELNLKTKEKKQLVSETVIIGAGVRSLIFPYPRPVSTKINFRLHVPLNFSIQLLLLKTEICSSLTHHQTTLSTRF